MSALAERGVLVAFERLRLTRSETLSSVVRAHNLLSVHVELA